MKKAVALGLTVMMSISLAACGNSADKENETTKKEAETTITADKDTNTKADGTVGEILVADFQAQAAEAANAQELADGILGNSIIEFTPMTMEVQAGPLTGFDSEISGFEEGVMFSPMIGSIPFVGYIFTIADGDDPDVFIQTLTDSANPRWNVCTEADETVVDNIGNYVFFLMCPESFDDAE